MLKYNGATKVLIFTFLMTLISYLFLALNGGDSGVARKQFVAGVQLEMVAEYRVNLKSCLYFSTFLVLYNIDAFIYCVAFHIETTKTHRPI